MSRFVAQGMYVILRDRKQAGVKNNGKIISNLCRNRYGVESIGEQAGLMLNYTVKVKDVVFIPSDEVFTVDGLLVCKWDAIRYVEYEDLTDPCSECNMDYYECTCEGEENETRNE